MSVYMGHSETVDVYSIRTMPEDLSTTSWILPTRYNLIEKFHDVGASELRWRCLDQRCSPRYIEALRTKKLRLWMSCDEVLIGECGCWCYCNWDDQLWSSRCSGALLMTVRYGRKVLRWCWSDIVNFDNNVARKFFEVHADGSTSMLIIYCRKIKEVLANDGMASAEGSAERCQLEIIDVDVSVGMIGNKFLDTSESSRWWYDVGGRSCREMLIGDRQHWC